MMIWISIFSGVRRVLGLRDTWTDQKIIKSLNLHNWTLTPSNQDINKIYTNSMHVYHFNWPKVNLCSTFHTYHMIENLHKHITIAPLNRDHLVLWIITQNIVCVSNRYWDLPSWLITLHCIGFFYWGLLLHCLFCFVLFCFICFGFYFLLLFLFLFLFCFVFCLW